MLVVREHYRAKLNRVLSNYGIRVVELDRDVIAKCLDIHITFPQNLCPKIPKRLEFSGLMDRIVTSQADELAHVTEEGG